MKQIDLRTHFQESLKALQAPGELIIEFNQATDAELQNWVLLIDESPFSLKEWNEALIAMKEWEKAQNRCLALAHRFEYLSCCAVSAQSFPKLVSFSDLLKEFLHTYGVA